MLKAFDHIIKLKYAFCMLRRELVLLFGVKSHLFMPIYIYVNNGKEPNFVNLNQSFTVSKQKNEFSWDIRLTFFIYAIFTCQSERRFFFSYRKCHEIYSTQCTLRSNHCQMRMKKIATLCTLFIYWKRKKCNVSGSNVCWVNSFRKIRINNLCSENEMREMCCKNEPFKKCLMYFACHMQHKTIKHMTRLWLCN